MFGLGPRPKWGAPPLAARLLHQHSDSRQPADRPVEAQIAPQEIVLRQPSSLTPSAVGVILGAASINLLRLRQARRRDVTSFTCIGRRLGYRWETVP